VIQSQCGKCRGLLTVALPDLSLVSWDAQGQCGQVCGRCPRCRTRNLVPVEVRFPEPVSGRASKFCSGAASRLARWLTAGARAAVVELCLLTARWAWSAR
jgi:hypothetical protein